MLLHCDTVRNVHYLTCPIEVLKCLKFLQLNLVPWACTLAMVIEGLVPSVYKVMTRSSFGITWQHKASGDKWTFRHCVKRLHLNLTR